MSRKSYAILGTGRFGNCLAKMLAESGQDVVVIDNEAGLLTEIENVVSKVVIGDISDPDVLAEIGIRNFDIIIIGRINRVIVILQGMINRLRRRFDISALNFHTYEITPPVQIIIPFKSK